MERILKENTQLIVTILTPELEFVSIEKRSLVGNLSLAIALTVGGVYQPWLLKLVGDWKFFLVALYIQCAAVFVLPW